MLGLWVVEHLDAIEHILPCLGAGFVGSAPYPLPLEQVEEAFGDSVIVAVSASAHRMFEVVRSDESCPVHDGKLGALV